VPDGGVCWLLQLSFGRPRALRLILLGESLDAATAHDWGLVSQCVPDVELDEFGASLAGRLARGPSLAYRLIRREFDAAPASAYAEQIELEASLQGIACRTADFEEGRRAFVERRDPVFRGA
jgi:2-(1,2-epoxy-1,2-dihydrophenyl)acetyl-CoA isomerase